MTNTRFRHYKNGKTYRVLANKARLEAQGLEGEAHVVYQCEETGQVWVRPAMEFAERVLNEHGQNVPRFALLDRRGQGERRAQGSRSRRSGERRGGPEDRRADTRRSQEGGPLSSDRAER